MSHPVQRRRHHRPGGPPQSTNKFFHIDASNIAKQSPNQPSPTLPTADDEFVDRLRQDIRYYSQPMTKQNREARAQFNSHYHGRISDCSRAKVPSMTFNFYPTGVKEGEDRDSLVSEISSETRSTFTTNVTGTTTTTQSMNQPLPEFEGNSKGPSMSMAQLLAAFMEINDPADIREAVNIPIKENDVVYRTLKFNDK